MKIKGLLVAASMLPMVAACDGYEPGGMATGDRAITDQPAPGLDMEVEIPFESFTLDNGLRVVVHEDRKAPVVAVSVWYHVGSKDEPEGKTGFAHLFEHLMFNGTENYDDEFFKPFEEVGATGMNGTTWFDRTNYFATVPTPALDMALWMESDRMGHLLGAVSQSKLDEQRGVVQNEKRQGDNQPFGTVQYRQLEGLFPPGHPYRHSTIGSMADLDAASLEDVKEWFRTYYGAANAVLVLAGDIDSATARPLVEKYFGDIAAGPALRRHKAWVPVKTTNTVEEMFDRVPNARLYRNWAAAPRTERDAHMLRLAADVLGGGKTSRLYQALVYERQLASEVSVQLQPFELASNFEIQIDLKDGADAGEVEAIVDDVMADFLRDGPTPDEVSRAKTVIIAGVVRGLEEVGGFGGKAVALAQGALYAGDPGFYGTVLGWLNAASTGDVTRAARTWLEPGHYQLSVRPYPEYSTAEAGADRSRLPAVGVLPELSFPAVSEATLANGMTVVLATRDTVPVVNVALQFDAGYAADQGRTLGTSSFTLAMLDEGTATRSALDISAETDRLGASLSTGSNLDMSQVRLSALKPNLASSLDLMADVVRNPAFDTVEIDRLKQRWMAQIAREKAQPVQLALRTLPPLLYGEGHAYAIPYTGSGTEASIGTLDRDDLAGFHRDWLRPDNATVYVVGDITMDEALPLLETAFGDWQAPAEPVPAKNIADVALPPAPRVIIMDKPGSPQSLILAGHLLPSTGAADALELDTANDILGGEFTARVNMNLREDKGWAYGAYTINFDARGQRMWLVYAPVQTDRTRDSIRELLSEFNSYLGQGLLGGRPASAEELSRMVQTKTNSLPGQFETSGAVLGALLSGARFDRPYDYPAMLKGRYDALALNAVRGAANAHIRPGALTWLIVGDRSRIEEEIRDLDLGTVEVWGQNGAPIE